LCRYQLDTLPIRCQSIHDLKPGDLVFYLGNYVNPKTKPQKHNCVHVEVLLLLLLLLLLLTVIVTIFQVYIGGEKTLGARWGKGVVQVKFAGVSGLVISVLKLRRSTTATRSQPRLGL
jgi:hypothetical protein